MRQVQTLLGPMWVHDQDHLGQVLETGAFWDGQLKPYLDEAAPGSIFIDVGANVGFLSRYMAQRGHQVLAVEAWPETVDLLRLNTGGTDITVMGCVAYDRTCRLSLAPSSFLGWEPSPQSPNVSSYAFIPDPWHGTIPSRVLDEWLIGIDGALWSASIPVGLIKVDAQGCDLRALRGLQQTIAEDRPLILFEFEEAASSWHGDTWSDYERFFFDRQYTIERVREDIWDYVARPGREL